MKARLRYVLALSAIGIACSWVDGRAQSPASSGTSLLSASVLVTWMTHNEGVDASVLDLAVFWRGTPGWFTAGDPRGRSGGGSSMVLPDGRSGPQTHFIGVGSLRLEVTFDPASRSAQVQDHNISTQDANVILVDEVDSPAGPRIISTIDAPFPNQPQRPRMEADTMQQMADLICARLKSPI
jgi:hypothetical protein